MTDYPEIEKMAAIKDKSQIIGEFVEWMWSEGYSIELEGMEIGEGSLNRLLADFFEIDLKKVEKEKQALLERVRKMEEAADRLFGGKPKTFVDIQILSEAEASVTLDRDEIGTYSLEKMPSHGDKGE